MQSGHFEITANQPFSWTQNFERRFVGQPQVFTAIGKLDYLLGGPVEAVAKVADVDGASFRLKWFSGQQRMFAMAGSYIAWSGFQLRMNLALARIAG
jgi:hypothetical protein